MALKPQITKTYAVEDKDYTISLIKRGTRFSFYIMLFLGVPVFLEADFLVNLWLVDVPDHAINFIRLVLLQSFIDSLSSGLVIGQNASGNIRSFTIVTSLITMTILVFSYLLLKFGFAPETTYLVSITVSLVLMVVNAFFVQNTIGLPVKEFLTDVFLNVVIVTIPAIIVPLLMAMVMADGWLRLALICITSVAFSSICVLYIGCSKGERAFIFDAVRKFFVRLHSRSR